MSRHEGGSRGGGLSTPHAMVLALVVVAAMGVVGGGAWWAVGGLSPMAAEIRDAAGSIAAVVDRDDDAGAAAAGRPLVAVVGDGFTAGVRGDDGERSATWPTLVCRDLGCDVTSYAAPGTGWSAAGSAGEDVASSLGDVVAAEPDVVVIAVGSADVGVGRPRVRGSVNQVLYRLERRLPGVPVVVLSPFAASAPAPADVAAVRSWVQEGVDRHDATLVDVSDLFDADHPDAVDAGGRPTAAGQQLVADVVAPYVEAALAPRG